MKKIVLIGGGGHCKSVLDAILRTKEYTNIVITDPDLEIGTEVLGCRIVGDDDELENLRENGFEFAFITVGSITDASLRKKLANKAENLGFRFPVVIDPSATVSMNTKLGSGVFVGKNAIINVDSIIGDHCIINTGSIVEHECFVGDYSHISIGTILCGNVHVGRKSFIGAGTTIIQGCSIGNKTVVGAGSVVVKDIPDNVKAYGNPCRVVE